MNISPIFQKDANKFVLKHHRHHRPVVGSIFQVALKKEGQIIGVAICGRPVGRKIDFTKVIEVNRLCVLDGQPNACSKLYATCARIAKEMGYEQIRTYILESEIGTSLKAAGWICYGEAGGKSWNSSGNRIRQSVTVGLFGEQKYPEQMKTLWVKQFN